MLKALNMGEENQAWVQEAEDIFQVHDFMSKERGVLLLLLLLLQLGFNFPTDFPQNKILLKFQIQFKKHNHFFPPGIDKHSVGALLIIN